MAGRLTDLERVLAGLKGRMEAHHMLLVTFIADLHLLNATDPEQVIDRLGGTLSTLTKDMKSDLRADVAAEQKAAMERELENMLAGLRNRVEPELRRRRGEPPGPKRPTVQFGPPSGKKPN